MNDDSEVSSDLEQRLEAARAKVGPKRRLYVADSPAGELILGAPRGVDYMAYSAMLRSEDAAERARAPNLLLLACAVDPDANGLKAILEDYVALAGNAAVAAAVANCIGTTKAEQAKK